MRCTDAPCLRHRILRNPTGTEMAASPCCFALTIPKGAMQAARERAAADSLTQLGTLGMQ